MTTLDKINGIGLNLNPAITDLRKAQQVSRTKAEMREMISDALKITTETQDNISKYRNVFDVIIIGEEKNSIYDEMQAVSDTIANAVFDILHGESMKAANDLSKLNMKLRGYP